MGWVSAEMTGSSSVMEIGVLWYRHLLSEYPRSSIYPWKIKDCFINGVGCVVGKFRVYLVAFYKSLSLVGIQSQSIHLSSVIVDVHYNNTFLQKIIYNQSFLFNSFLICFNSLCGTLLSKPSPQVHLFQVSINWKI